MSRWEKRQQIPLVIEPKKLYIRRNRRRKYALKATLQQAEGDRKAMVIAP